MRILYHHHRRSQDGQYVHSGARRDGPALLSTDDAVRTRMAAGARAIGTQKTNALCIVTLFERLPRHA